MTTAISSSFNTILTAMSAMIYILTVIGSWKIYNKMNEPGWKALIPIYNSYTLMKHVWNKKMGYAYIAAGLVTVIASANMQNPTPGNYTLPLIWSLIAFIAVVAFLIIKVLGFNKLAQAFGHKMGYTFGLIFFQPIFTMILGFGKDQYCPA